MLQLSQHIALCFVVSCYCFLACTAWPSRSSRASICFSISEEFAISNRHRYTCTFLLGLYLRSLVTLKLLYRLQFLFVWSRALEMATKGKCSVGHLSSMSSVDRVLLDESSILNTELVIAKIQKQNFHIPDFFFFLTVSVLEYGIVKRWEFKLTLAE